MKKILLIEDNADIRNNTAEILELSNYEVVVAENGKIGVAKAIENKPDLIICDIMMPELDGYGVLHAIQKNDSIKNTPFIFLTAKSERSDFRKGMELGADDYITKPFDGTGLLNAVSGRLKKIDVLKQELQPGLEGYSSLVQTAGGTKALQDFTKHRGINKYKKKQLIYSEGNHPLYLYYILQGKIKTFKTNEEGKQLVTELYNTGDFLGHIALFENSMYKESAEALEPTELAIIPKDEFDEMLATNPEVSKKFIQLLAKNITGKESQLLNLAYNSLRKKVAEALVSFQNKYREKKQTNFTLDISRENLAAIAGTATESLIRTLGDFRNEKLIDMHNGVITILNEEKLKNLIN